MKLASAKILNSIKIIIILGILTGLNTSSLHAQFEEYNHPELQWEYFETEHFVIIFHSGEIRTPRIVAKIAEEIYEPVTSAYHFEPDSKIDIIVRDHDDYSNGAAYYYDNKIEIWASSLDFLLRGSSNWLRNVVTHEFTHMVQMQTARKMPRRFPAVYLQHIGYEDERRADVLRGFPNSIVSYPVAGTVIPGWFAEGVAQYHTMKQGYDTWDSHRDMILRMQALNNGIFSLAEMGVFGKSSIGNESVYNQGFSFVAYLARKFGDDVLENISRAMSSPFAVSINRAISKACGQPAKALYEQWRTELEMHFLRRTDHIEKNLKQGDVLQTEGTANVFPTWSLGRNSFAYLSNNKSDYLSSMGLYLGSAVDPKRKLLKSGVVSPPVWDRTGKKIVYAKIEKNNDNSHFHDLFMLDIESGKEERLTFSMRARYPSFSPDGKTLYFVSSADGISTLLSLEITSGVTRVIKKFTGGEDLFSTTVAPNGNRIIFSVSSRFGRDIAIINADGSRFRYLLKEKDDERNPAFSPDGTKVYYSSDKTGIYNIYEYDLITEESRPVTNVLGGAFMPSVNNEGQMVYSLYTNSGYKLALIGHIEYIDPATMVYEPVIQGGTPDVEYDDTNIPEMQSNPYTFQYRSSTFLPRIMIDYGAPKLGFYSMSSDVLNKYSLLIGASINSELDRDLFALFDYRKFGQTLFVELYNFTRHETFIFPPSEDRAAETDEDVFGYWEVDVGARQKLSETQEIQVKAVIARQSVNIQPIIPGEHFRPLKFDYFRGFDFTVNWRYRDILPRLDSEINPSFGREIAIEYWRNTDKIFEDFVTDTQAGFLNEVYKKYTYHKITLDWREYIGLPFILDRSTLTIRLQGGFISEPVDDFLYFFAGGLTGMRGYAFYSLEGRKMLIGSAVYRFPVKKNIGFQFGPWYFDKLYGSVGYQAGDAWSVKTMDFNRLKKSIDLGLRLDMFSFYSYPTKIGFQAAYGFDELQVSDRTDGKQWKYYFTVLFGYDY